MKINLTSFLLTAVVLLSASSASMAFDWITFKSDPGRFSVLMPGPGDPKLDAKTVQSEHGPYTTNLFAQPSDKGIFLVGYVDYSPSFNFDNQKELIANRDNFIKGLKGSKLVSERPVKFGQSPGLEFIAETDAVTVRSRVYIIGRRPYMLIAVTRKGMDDSANVERFLSSFKITTPERQAVLITE